MQAVPFRVNWAGTALEPLYAPWKPNCTLPFAAMVALYDMFTAVTPCPDWVTVAFQALLIVWLPAKLHFSVQPLMPDEPLLVIVTLAVKPLPQSLSVYPTLHAAPPVALGDTLGDADGDRLGETEGLGDADRLGEADGDALGEADRVGEADGLVEVGGLPPLLFFIYVECAVKTDISAAPCLTA